MTKPKYTDQIKPKYTDHLILIPIRTGNST